MSSSELDAERGRNSSLKLERVFNETVEASSSEPRSPNKNTPQKLPSEHLGSASMLNESVVGLALRKPPDPTEIQWHPPLLDLLVH